MSAASASPYGFKEWSLVCAALGSGAQSIILRKGGIHEGKAGFWWRHDRFFLFPTHFHGQTAEFPWTPHGGMALTEDPDALHRIGYFAEVVSKHQLTDWETVLRLKDLHFWTETTLRGRFDYSESAGISLAFLRIHRLEKPWVFADEKKFGGCRSWLDLPALPEQTALTPVLDEARHTATADALAKALKPHGHSHST